MCNGFLTEIYVRARPGNRAQGWLTAGSQRIPVAIGRSGIKANKREGDGGTPRGRFRLVRLWWRADRAPPPRTMLPLRRITANDAWCETPSDRRYNRPIRLGLDASADRLQRSDNLYDLVIEIDHNSRPRVAGRGSAVFIHIARPGFLPTAGCVALRARSLHLLLTRLTSNTHIVIG
jgi:L,D-peptidoglycan transpeptidase YkuD (ErfK/YbiS/YcfS/YnhG family)